jgi:hypothetical protein
MRSSDETDVFRLFALFAGTPREVRRRRGKELSTRERYANRKKNGFTLSFKNIGGTAKSKRNGVDAERALGAICDFGYRERPKRRASFFF